MFTFLNFNFLGKKIEHCLENKVLKTNSLPKNLVSMLLISF